MSRRERRAPARERTAAKPSRGAVAGRRILVRIAIVLLLGAAIALVIARRHRVPATPEQVVAAMPPDLAYNTALKLMQQRRSFASLPYFRRALGATSQPSAGAHLNFGGALYNSLFESDTLAGCARYRWATSLERAQAMNECLEQMLAAVQQAPTPHDRAECCDRLGRMLNTWGFRWEALLWFSQAGTLEPGNTRYTSHHDALLHQLQEPSRHEAALEDPATR